MKRRDAVCNRKKGIRAKERSFFFCSSRICVAGEEQLCRRGKLFSLAYTRAKREVDATRDIITLKYMEWQPPEAASKEWKGLKEEWYEAMQMYALVLTFPQAK